MSDGLETLCFCLNCCPYNLDLHKWLKVDGGQISKQGLLSDPKRLSCILLLHAEIPTVFFQDVCFWRLGSSGDG